MSIKEKKIIKVLVLILFILVGIISFNYQCEVCYLINSSKNVTKEVKETKEIKKEEVQKKRLTLKEKIEEAKKMMTIMTREEDKDEVELFIRS